MLDLDALGKGAVMKDRTNERTETDERIAENQTPAPRISVIKDTTHVDPATGLPEGMHDDDRSPLDPGALRDHRPGVKKK
jgi:hypothetical protein